MALAQVLFKKIGPHHKLLTISAYFAGLACLAIFPSFDRRTEVEEHGLIPGYASSGFERQWASRLHSVIDRIAGGQDLSTALDEALLNSELVAHRMNFTAHGRTKSSLVYTVVPSRRGDSREAVVLVIATNWTAVKRAPARAAYGLGIGVVLAQYLKSVHWLSKDVLLVFIDSSLPYGAGARAWLQSYFGGSSAVRRGVLRQAVVLEVGQKTASVSCDVEGINGMVPNQDIVNAYTVGADRRSLAVAHRESWDSVAYHFMNGGVHSSHAPFLELQVPAFTVKGERRGRGSVQPETLAQSLEGIVRCLSNNLQQLHHSFNFYFFTAASRHISSGLYLYPVFAMQLPLLSFLMSSPAYRNIRSFLVGLGVIAVVIVATGSPIFLLATDAGFVEQLGNFFPSLTHAWLAEPPVCEHPSWDAASNRQRREAAAGWLTLGAAAAAAVAFLLRRFAFAVYRAEDASSRAGGCEAEGKDRLERQGVQLSSPLWEAVQAASGFAFLIILAPCTIISWPLAVPLTLVSVPWLILVKPMSLRRRPLRSCLLLTFLGGNAFLIAVPPEVRAELLGAAPGRMALNLYEFYDQTLVPSLPREARPYLPTPLVRWLKDGQLAAGLSGDLLLVLYEAARDFRCVGGFLFPAFCFAYWPLLVLLALVGGVLPAQRVSEEGLTLQQLRLGTLLVLSLVLGFIVMGVFWRSTSSSGLGKLQWS